MTTLATISAKDAFAKVEQGALLIDIRNVDEHQREYIQGAISATPAELQTNGLPKPAQNAPIIIFHCKGGIRTKEAAPLLAQCAGNKDCFILEGGLNAWKAAGLKTIFNSKQPLELMRQVQIAAGGLALLGVILGYLLSPWFFALSGFVGAGLMVAGITGFCGMARLLKVMPWNKGYY